MKLIKFVLKLAILNFFKYYDTWDMKMRLTAYLSKLVKIIRLHVEQKNTQFGRGNELNTSNDIRI